MQSSEPLDAQRRIAVCYDSGRSGKLPSDEHRTINEEPDLAPTAWCQFLQLTTEEVLLCSEDAV